MICDIKSEEQKYCNGLILSLQRHEKNTYKAIDDAIDLDV